MTGFKEHFKNEKRTKTLNFFKNIFSSIFSRKAWYFIFFWIFLVGTLYMFYTALTFKNKFPVECGKIVKLEAIDGDNPNNDDRIGYHIFVQTQNGIEDCDVKPNIYKKYETLLKTDSNVSYCESYTDKLFVFYIFVTIILAIITIVFLFSSFD